MKKILSYLTICKTKEYDRRPLFHGAFYFDYSKKSYYSCLVPFNVIVYIIIELYMVFVMAPLRLINMNIIKRKFRE